MDDFQPYVRPPMELHDETRVTAGHLRTSWFFKWLSVNSRMLMAAQEARRDAPTEAEG